MRGGLCDEWRAATDVERFSGTAGGSRIFCNVLDEVSDVDSRTGQSERKFLDEDGVPDSGHAAWHDDSGGDEGWRREDGTDWPDAGAIVFNFAGWGRKNSGGDRRDAARNRSQRIWAGGKGRNFRRQFEDME